jgi:hypothetical protein
MHIHTKKYFQGTGSILQYLAIRIANWNQGPIMGVAS